MRSMDKAAEKYCGVGGTKRSLCSNPTIWGWKKQLFAGVDAHRGNGKSPSSKISTLHGYPVYFLSFK